jgi:hypothetical protein
VFAAAPVLKSSSAPSSPSAAIHDAKPAITPNFKSTIIGDF